MRSFARDIQITLLIKLTLLFILWFICFKNTKKPSIDTEQWMLGKNDVASKAAHIDTKHNFKNNQKGAL